jgi:hypothetical protein
VEDILSKVKSLGIAFEEEEDEHLNQLSSLQEALEEAEQQRTWLEQESEETIKQDIIIPKLRKAISDVAKKLR